MAHETLKNLITNNIKTNGHNAITAQILQDVLIAMVDEYPDTSGYLPRTGGTIKGSSNDYKVNILPNGISVQYSDVSSDTDTITEISSTGIYFKETEEEFIRIYKYSTQLRIQLEEGDYASLRAGSFIKNGGTSAQFLKADGSVDSNTYVTASALTGYATQSWVTTQLGNYLPLTGGTITGNLTVNGNLQIANNNEIYFSNSDIRIKRVNSRLLIVNELTDDIIIGNYANGNYTSIVNDLQGGTTDATYTSVSSKWSISVDGTAYFKSVSQTSDLRKKTIIGDVPINLYNVANAPLFKFTWNNETKYSGQHIGSAAQYWQTVLPELVSIGRDADMTLAMQYDVIALASAITVAKTVVNHEERIILLERENEALKKEIADLKSA